MRQGARRLPLSWRLPNGTMARGLVKQLPGLTAVLAVAVAFGWVARSPLVSLLTIIVLREGTWRAALIGLGLSLLFAAVQFTERVGGSDIVASWLYWTVAAGVLAELVQGVRARWSQGSESEEVSPRARGELRRIGTRLQTALRQPAEQDRLARLIVRAGAVCLLLAFAFIVWARSSLPLTWLALFLAGIVPFVLWGIKMVEGAVALRREVALAALIVAVAGAEVIFPNYWQAPSPKATVVFNFLVGRAAGHQARGMPEPQASTWTLGQWTRPVLVMRPTNRQPARWEYEIQVPAQAVLTFAVGASPETWGRAGDGITFKVLIDGPRGVDTIFDLYLNAKARAQDKPWHDARLSLAKYAGETVKLLFVVQAGPWGDARFDIGGWAEPILWGVPVAVHE
ncbi:MAG: hypothetical protein IT330_07365 [Anaerolineae bacterium]|nr:hypothetical protein [Anaerolineae bacterium]